LQPIENMAAQTDQWLVAVEVSVWGGEAERLWETLPTTTSWSRTTHHV